MLQAKSTLLSYSSESSLYTRQIYCKHTSIVRCRTVSRPKLHSAWLYTQDRCCPSRTVVVAAAAGDGRSSEVDDDFEEYEEYEEADELEEDEAYDEQQQPGLAAASMGGAPLDGKLGLVAYSSPFQVFIHDIALGGGIAAVS